RDRHRQTREVAHDPGANNEDGCGSLRGQSGLVERLLATADDDDATPLYLVTERKCVQLTHCRPFLLRKTYRTPGRKIKLLISTSFSISSRTPPVERGRGRLPSPRQMNPLPPLRVEAEGRAQQQFRR